MEISGNISVAKVAKTFYCKTCDYRCLRKFNFDKHLATQKHKSSNLEISGNEFVVNVANPFFCKPCNKNFKTNSGLWKHNSKYHKTCTDTPEIVLKLVEQNKELQKQLAEQVSNQTNIMSEIIPKIGNTTNNTINNNQKFNINIFLNEDCKDAINMSDFVKSIQVSLDQLDLTKSEGLEKGVTNIIMENMKHLSVYERPMHCTDKKRETLYIKDDNKWEHDKEKTKIRNAIKKTCNKQYQALQDWTNDNPDFCQDDIKQDYFAKTVSVIGKSVDIVDDKIIKKLCKETYVSGEKK